MKIDIKEIWWKDGWIYVAQDRGKWRYFVNRVMKCEVPYAGKLLSS
jgi:hypothetical protein